MPGTDSPEPANNDVEKLFLQDILPIVPAVVGQACAKLNYHPGQTELDGLVQRVVLLLIDEDYRVLRSFDRRSEPQTWLFTIARRYILRRLREQGRIVSLDDMPPDSFTFQPDQEEWLLAKEREELLQAAYNKLSKREQKLYRLLSQPSLTAAEIARTMGIKRESVYKEKQRLIKKIQKIIEGMRK